MHKRGERANNPLPNSPMPGNGPGMPPNRFQPTAFNAQNGVPQPGQPANVQPAAADNDDSKDDEPDYCGRHRRRSDPAAAPNRCQRSTAAARPESANAGRRLRNRFWICCAGTAAGRAVVPRPQPPAVDTLKVLRLRVKLADALVRRWHGFGEEPRPQRGWKSRGFTAAKITRIAPYAPNIPRLQLGLLCC